MGSGLRHMRSELKLHLVKKLVNFGMRFIDKILPDSGVHYPQTRMMENVFQDLFYVYALEVYQGRYDDVPRQMIGGLKDRNFQHFLSASRKVLLFIGENDRYYRAWIGLAFKLAKEEYERVAGELAQEEFVRSYDEQWELRFSRVHPDYFQSYRSEFLDMMLACHLPNLLRKKIASSSLPQSKKQIEVK